MKYRALMVVAVSLLTSWTLPCRLRAQAGTTPANQAPATVRRVAGCYELTTGAWSRLPARGIPEARRPPSWFALDTVPPPHSFDHGYAVRPTKLTPRAHMPAFWAPVGTDSASIIWSTGFVGVRLQVAVRGDSLVGIARTFQDAEILGEPPPPEARVVAVRVPCDSEHDGRAGDTGERSITSPYTNMR
jgi:hypothetical protein